MVRSFAKILDLMGKRCREDGIERRSQATLNSSRRFVECEGLCKWDNYGQQDIVLLQKVGNC
ncbi:MAG: hypothetical protein WBE61_06035 [Nitrososphaeraceae archaeon]